MPIARIENLKRHYHFGDTTVHSLNGVSAEFDAGEFSTIEYPGLPEPAHRGEIPERRS
uniref:Putative ABC transport system ATP-binding protein n=1 Tax=Candidatus Kentrum sp. FW TaxID=2126338 RepID=A0A450SWC0_9GAMM|nr:MAG: putative ABC transport system ATP-binding protein [Candidatus Kentron sp. FW]